MPLTATSNYTATIGGRRIRMAAKCTVTLPGSVLLDITGTITDVRLGCSMATPLPDGVRAPSGDTTLDGSVTLSGTVVVSGQTLTVADLFDRYNQASPLWRMTARDCKVVYQIGPRIPGSVTPEFKTLADTWISDYTVNRADGTVTLTLTDVPPSWDQTPAIPPVITDPPYNAGLTGEFAMDNLIRQMDGASSWPALRSNVVLAVGMRGSLYPEVGSFAPGIAIYGTTAAQQDPQFGPGVGGTALAVYYDASAPLNTWPGWAWGTSTPIAGDFFTEFDITGLATGTIPLFIAYQRSDGGDGGMNIIVSRTALTIQCGTDSPTGATGDYVLSTSLGATAHHIAIAIRWGIGTGSYSGWVEIDGVQHTIAATTVPGSNRSSAMQWDFAQIENGGTTTPTCYLSGWQTTTETTSAVSSFGFYPHFVCDTSLNPLTAVPAIDKGTAPLDVLETIAAAECGLIQRIPDPNDASGGQLRFTNRLTLLGYDPARGRTITSLDSLKGYTDSTPPSAAIRTVEVPYSEWDFGSAGLIWSASARKKIKANTTRSWKQKLPDGALAATIDTTVALAPTSGNVSDGGSYYLVSGNAAGNKTYNGTLNITLTLVSPDTVLVSVEEPNGQDAWLSVPGTYSGPITVGSPALWIGGIPATVGQEALARSSVGSGTGVLSVPSNPYIQDHDTALALAQFLTGQLSNDVDTFDGVDIIPDGTILCGDLEKVTDQYGHLDDWMLVWGWSHEASWQPGQPATFGQTVDLRPLGPPGSWLMGFPGRSEMGSTTFIYAAS